jgi:hypothetical protein
MFSQKTGGRYEREEKSITHCIADSGPYNGHVRDCIRCSQDQIQRNTDNGGFVLAQDLCRRSRKQKSQRYFEFQSRKDQEGATGEIYRYLAKRARGTAYITDDGADEVGENCKKISFSYFPSNGKVYLMNCDFAGECTFYLHVKDMVQKITLQPAEFKVVEP